MKQAMTKLIAHSNWIQQKCVERREFIKQCENFAANMRNNLFTQSFDIMC